MAKDILCDCEFKFNSTIFNSDQKWNNKICQFRKDHSCNPSPWICEHCKYLKSVADTQEIERDETYICYGHCIKKFEKYHSNKCNKKLLL